MKTVRQCSLKFVRLTITTKSEVHHRHQQLRVNERSMKCTASVTVRVSAFTALFDNVRTLNFKAQPCDKCVFRYSRSNVRRLLPAYLWLFLCTFQSKTRTKIYPFWNERWNITPDLLTRFYSNIPWNTVIESSTWKQALSEHQTTLNPDITTCLGTSV